MNRQKREKINALADMVRNALRLSSPVSVAMLCDAVERLGGRIEKRPTFFVKNEASIVKDGDSFNIVLDSTKPERRMLFSLAHELGHLFVHMGFGDKVRWDEQKNYIESYAREGYDEEEFEAHEFAAALLMPKAEFLRLYSQKSVDELAEYFGVSPNAALVRGRWLGVYKWS